MDIAVGLKRHLASTVQRFATRRQPRTCLGRALLNYINSVTILHALGAVYSGAREASGGANHVSRRREELRFPPPPFGPLLKL